MTFFAPSLNFELMASLNICGLEGGCPLEISIPIAETTSELPHVTHKFTDWLRTLVFQHLSKIIQGGQRRRLVSEFLEQGGALIPGRERVNVLRRLPCSCLSEIPILREYDCGFPTCNASQQGS